MEAERFAGKWQGSRQDVTGEPKVCNRTDGKVFLDWVLFPRLKRVRLPGTEDMDKEYRQKWFHVKVMLPMVPVVADRKNKENYKILRRQGKT